LYRCINVEKVVIFRDRCIACGACIAFCPYGALEPDEEDKPVLIWDLCRDDFACVIVCPVVVIKRASEAGALPTVKWYKVSRAELYPEAEAWRAKLAAAHGGSA
jgi:ferredoxin